MNCYKKFTLIMKGELKSDFKMKTSQWRRKFEPLLIWNEDHLYLNCQLLPKIKVGKKPIKGFALYSRNAQDVFLSFDLILVSVGVHKWC